MVQAYIDRCRMVNPLVNAIVEDRFEDALEEGRQIDAEIARLKLLKKCNETHQYLGYLLQ